MVLLTGRRKENTPAAFSSGRAEEHRPPNLLRVQRRSSALQSQQRLHICSLIGKQLLQTSASAVKVKNTKGSRTDRRGNLRVKHQVSEALKSPDDYRRHSALCDVCNKLQVEEGGGGGGGRWRRLVLLRVGQTLGSFRAPEFPQEKIHIVEEEEEEGSGRVQRKESFSK